MTAQRPGGAAHLRGAGPSTLWLVVVAAMFTACFVLVDKVFVHTTRGQRVDDAGLAGSVIGRARIISKVDQVLNLVSVSALVVAVLVVGGIGLARRRPGLAAVGIAVLAVTNVSTHLLKTQLLIRPDLGVDQTAGFAHNTLPSGHTTVAISVSAALLLVAAPRARGAIAVLGAIASAVMGVSTLSAGWHRPSDAIAAYLVVGAWVAGLAAIAMALNAFSAAGMRPTARGLPGVSLALLGTGAAGCLAAGALALAKVGQVPEATGKRHLFLAYAGGSALVTGTALATMAIVAVIAHELAR